MISVLSLALGLSRGRVTERLQEAYRRLCILEDMPRSVSNKLYWLQQSIWPAAFSGLEGYFVASQEVEKLRVAASCAVLGKRGCHSPFLALSALSEGAYDPEVYLVIQSFRTLARALCATPSVGADWLQRVAACDAPSRVPAGPSSAFAGLLARNGWVLRTTGEARGPGTGTLTRSQCRLRGSRGPLLGRGVPLYRTGWAIAMAGSGWGPLYPHYRLGVEILPCIKSVWLAPSVGAHVAGC